MNSQWILLFFLVNFFLDKHLFTFVTRLRPNGPKKTYLFVYSPITQQTHEFSMNFTVFVCWTFFSTNIFSLLSHVCGQTAPKKLTFLCIVLSLKKHMNSKWNLLFLCLVLKHKHTSFFFTRLRPNGWQALFLLYVYCFLNFFFGPFMCVQL